MTLWLYFLFFSFSCSLKIVAVCFSWLDQELTCVTRTSKNRYSWCPKTPCFHIQPRFSTDNSGLKVEYFIVEWLQEWLCLHISAHFTNVRCQEISDSIMSLTYKTSILECQRMVDSKHFSTSTVTREIRQRKVVAKAKGVPKLLRVLRLE